MKKTLFILFIAVLLIGLFGCSDNSNNPDESSSDLQVDYDAAEIEFTKYIDSLKLPSYFGSTTTKPESNKYDITGDGYVDLFRLLQYGSGMQRVSFSMYDPVNHKGYILDSYNFSYRVESCDDDGLVIVKYDAATGEKFVGTIILENDELIFIEN